MRKTWAVARKELRQIARDPLSLIMLVGLPAFMLVLYGFALNFDVRHVAPGRAGPGRQPRPAATSLSAFVQLDLLRRDGRGRGRRRPRAHHPRARGQGRARDPARVTATTSPPGRTAAVQLLLDGTDASTAQTILGYAGAITSETNLRLLARRAGAARARAPPDITEYEPRVFYNPELRSTQFLVPGLIGFLLMLTAVLSTAMSVVREKERGTMEQIRVSPVRTVELILGKATPYLAISLLATAIILVAARVLFGVVVRGSYLDLFVVTVLYLVGALGFGLLISTLADTQALAFQIGLLTSLLPAILLSGFIFPIRTMPVVLRAITNLVPARHFLVVLRGNHPEGRGPRAVPRAARRARALRRGDAGARLAAHVPAGGLIRDAHPLARHRQGAAAAPAGPQDAPRHLRGAAPADRRLRLRGQHRGPRGADGPGRPGPQPGQPRPGGPLRVVGLLRAGRGRGHTGATSIPGSSRAAGTWRSSSARATARRAKEGRRPPRVQMIADGSDSSASTQALGYASAIVNGADQERVRALVATVLGHAAPGADRPRAPRVFYNSDLKSRWFYVPAVLAMILMIMTMLLSAMAVVREKEIGTLEQLMVTPVAALAAARGQAGPVRRHRLVAGVPGDRGRDRSGSACRCAGRSSLLLAITQLFLLNTLGLGLLVSTLVRNQQQAMMAAAFLVMIPMIYLSGLIFPIENMPPAIQTITYAIPLRYYSNVIRGIFLKGAGLADLWRECVILAAMGTGILAVASLRFRKRLD